MAINTLQSTYTTYVVVNAVPLNNDVVRNSMRGCALVPTLA